MLPDELHRLAREMAVDVSTAKGDRAKMVEILRAADAHNVAKHPAPEPCKPPPNVRPRWKSPQEERDQAITSPVAFRAYLMNAYDRLDVLCLNGDNHICHWRGQIESLWDMARTLADYLPPPLPHIDSIAAAKSAIDQLVTWVNDSLRGQTVALTDEDRYILNVLDAHQGKALTFSRIETESTRMNRDDPQRIKRLSDRTIRQRVPVLVERGWVARPLGTKKKGISITESGHDAVIFAAGNTPETRRKN
jgi:hypothetical protein